MTKTQVFLEVSNKLKKAAEMREIANKYLIDKENAYYKYGNTKLGRENDVMISDDVCKEIANCLYSKALDIETEIRKYLIGEED